MEDHDWFPLDMKSNKNNQANSDAFSFSSMVVCCGLELIHKINKASKAAETMTETLAVDEVVTRKPCCLGETITEKMTPAAGFNLLKRFSDYDFFKSFKPASELDALLSTIAKNVEHWKLLNAQSVHQKVYFLLNSWLEGIRPPPRCQALMNDAQCLEEAATKNNSPFCSLLHRCHANSCTKVIIINIMITAITVIPCETMQDC